MGNKRITKIRGYEKYLEVKYLKYGRSLIDSWIEKKIIEEEYGTKPYGIFDDSREWEKFFKTWNKWSDEEKKEYLYFITNIENRDYIKWFFYFVVILSFVIGLVIGLEVK